MEEFDTIRAIINKSITISLDELYRSELVLSQIFNLPIVLRL
jgi:hypothetical protein